MQFSFEQLLVDFEKALGCRLTLHDPMHILADNMDICHLTAGRCSHRKTFPEMCGRESREYCISQCMFRFNKWTEKTRRPIYVMHCRNGFWQLAVPIYRDNVHVLSLFAGLWRRFDDKERIRRIARMLPIFADGAFRMLEGKLSEKSMPSNTMAARIRNYLAANYNRPLQTADLAKHLSLSVSRTCAVVKDECSAPFKELLTIERIRHAKLYLEQSDLRVKEIALLCGFASPEHFVRTFQKLEKCTPGRWRASRRI